MAAPRSDGPAASGAAIPATLRAALEAMGLSGNESGVLLGLLRLGSATAPQVASAAGVAATNVYRVLASLEQKGLVHRVSAPGPALWSCPGPDEIIDSIERARREHTHQLRRDLADWAAPLPPVDAPHVHVIHDPAQAALTYERLVVATERELLIFTRPPYSTSPTPSQSVIDMLSRGCEARAIYEADDAAELDALGALRPYHDAGVQGRVVDKLPVKLAIFDRRVVLLSMANPILPDVGFPTTLHVEHPGFAEVLVPGFEARWAEARPFEVEAGTTRRRTRPARSGAK